MTIAPEKNSGPRLTANDHILTRAGHDPRDNYSLPWSLGVTFHIRPETRVVIRVHKSEDRVVIRLGGARAELDVFAGVDQLDRLITLLTAARERLR